MWLPKEEEGTTFSESSREEKKEKKGMKRTDIKKWTDRGGVEKGATREERQWAIGVALDLLHTPLTVK